jgi:hypothetical protein
MANILVMANETIGGSALLKAVKDRDAKGDAKWFLVVPQNRPRHGTVIYDEAVRDAAQVRVDLARDLLKDEDIKVTGDVGDEDPFTAAMDAIADWDIDEVIVSTLPSTSSGWLRRDLIERIGQASGLPVEHVVSDIESEGLPFDVTLVLANKTARGNELRDAIQEKDSADAGRRRLFIVVVPQEDGSGKAARTARRRLDGLCASLRSEDMLCAGVIGDPDPYRAAMNALQSFRVSDVLVSTLPSEKSGWLREDLPNRIASDTGLKVDHIVVSTDQPKVPA